MSAEEGRRLYQLYGCIACHAIEATQVARLGPTWKGLYGSQRTFANGRRSGDRRRGLSARIDPRAGGEDRDGIRARRVGMPSYAGVLTDAQIESIILFIKSLEANTDDQSILSAGNLVWRDVVRSPRRNPHTSSS